MSDFEASPILAHLHRFLETRQPPKTFCPSEVARTLSATELDELGLGDWRAAMPIVREAVFALRAKGECEVLQKGQVLDLSIGLEDVRGPIRVRRGERK